MGTITIDTERSLNKRAKGPLKKKGPSPTPRKGESSIQLSGNLELIVETPAPHKKSKGKPIRRKAKLEKDVMKVHRRKRRVRVKGAKGETDSIYARVVNTKALRKAMRTDTSRGEDEKPKSKSAFAKVTDKRGKDWDEDGGKGLLLHDGKATPKFSEDHNCLTCRRWTSCDKPKKSYKYICPSYRIQSAQALDISSELIPVDFAQEFLAEANKIPSITYTDDFDIREVIEELLSNESPLPRDLRMDDREVPEAANIFEFIIDKKFLGVRLFARQMEIALRTEGEICPKCSDMTWFDRPDGCQVNTELEEFEEHLTLLEFGKCPKCNGNRSEFILEGLTDPIIQLAACIGQRAGKNFTFCIMAAYKIHKILKMSSPQLAYGIGRESPLHATFVGLTFAGAKATTYDQIQEILTRSPWFCIEENEPITLADNTSKPIRDIKIGDEVKTLEGTSPVTNVFDNGVQEVFELELADGTILKATAEHKVRCLINGELVWVKMKDLTDDHEVVLDD